MFAGSWRTHRIGKELRNIGALKPLLQRHPRLATAIVVLGVLETVTEGIGITLFIPFLYSLDADISHIDADDWLGRALDMLFTSIPADHRLLIVSLAIFGLIILKGVLAYASRLLFAWLDLQLSHYLCCGIYDRLLAVPLQIIEQQKTGQWLNLVESETYATSDATATALGLFINLAAMVIFTGLLLLISWQLTLFVCVSLLAISFLVRLATKRIESLSRAGLRADEAFSQRILELLSGLRTIRLFGRESHQRDKFDRAVTRTNRINFRLEVISGLIEPVSETLAAIVLLLVLFFSLQNPENLAAVLTFLFILFRMQPQVAGLDESRAELAAATAPIKKVTDFMTRHKTAGSTAGKVAFEKLQDSIVIDALSFSHGPNAEPVLQDISARLDRGCTTAIVGPSGSGKSTLINLLLQFYQPLSGGIRVDDVALADLDVRTWRSRLAVVGQNDFLFDASVKDNIAYGRLGANDEDILEAAQQASADDFIRALPNGYSTRIGDRGTRLSEGQKQRICIARALLRDPDILVLDEATNALDSLTEHAIQRAIAEPNKRRTVIVVAHRLASIELADHILVLDRGRLVEQGNLSQLMSNDALFARLRELQTGGPSRRASVKRVGPEIGYDNQLRED